MVNREVVLQTIRKMYDNGIDDGVVAATLKDIGLSEAEVKQYIFEVRGKQQEAPVKEEEKHEKIAEKTAEKIKQHLDADREERELRDTTQHAAIEEQHGRIESVESKVGQLHEKFDTASRSANANLGNGLGVLEQKINGLERQLQDIKAISTATKDLMEKVLEVNRKILNKL